MGINKFQYNSGIGGVGGGSSSVFYSSVPSNMYIDAVVPFYENYTIALSNFYNIDYYIDKLNNVTISPQLIDLNGLNTSLDHTYSNSYSTIASSVVVKRIINGLGLQKDRVLIDSILYGSYQYLSLQRAISVVQYMTVVSSSVTSTTLIAPNSTTTITPSQIFRLNKALSRGAEISSNWEVYKTDPLGTFLSIPAILGVDYSLTIGTLASDLIQIQFLSNYNFELRVNLSGYTFNNNPYYLDLSDLSTNSSITAYFFQAATIAPTFTYEIKLPRLSPNLTITPTTSLVSTTPITTYQNQIISISTLPETNVNCYWKKIDLSGTLAPQILLKSDAEWLAEITTKCNIVFEIRKITSNELILTKIIDVNSSFNVTIQSTGDFNMQYITTLK